jgi:hypothetical protein
MEDTLSRETRAASGLDAPHRAGRRAGVLWVLLLALAWWDAFHRAFAGMDGPIDDRALMLSAAAATAAKLGGHASESAAYASWWRMRRVALPWSRLFVWVVTYSMFDLFGLWMLREGAGPFTSPVLLAVLAGPPALRERLPGVSLGLWTAFGATGLFALLRLLATADRQRRGTGRGWREPLTLTLGLWLATRLLQWWSVDLLGGRSVLPM